MALMHRLAAWIKWVRITLKLIAVKKCSIGFKLNFLMESNKYGIPFGVNVLSYSLLSCICNAKLNRKNT